jgi:hypothetical protein
MVSAKSANVDAAKAYIKWLWIDNTKDQEDFNLSYGFHIPPRKSLAAQATKLQSGPAADALKIFNDDRGRQQPGLDAEDEQRVRGRRPPQSSARAATSTRTWPRRRRRSTPSSPGCSADMSAPTLMAPAADTSPPARQARGRIGASQPRSGCSWARSSSVW